MARNQIQEDEAVARRVGESSEEHPKPSRLRKTDGKERRHRDRGQASDSPSWREHKGRQRD